jgi:ribonuclease P/MRP protein subunit POP1
MWPKPSNDAHAAIQRSWLATAILTQPPEPGQGDYPRVPDQQDLIGYITTGNFSLKEGRGVGIGSVLVSRVLADNEDCDIDLEVLRLLKATHRLCIVRNPGQVHGRLAFWELL